MEGTHRIRFTIIIVIILILLSLNYEEIGRYISFYGKRDGSEYAGQINAQNDINKDKVLITIPEGYYDKGGKHNYYIDLKEQTGKYIDVCEISIYHVANFKNADHLSLKMAEYHKTNREIISINGLNWYYFYNNNRVYENGYYLIDDHNKILLVEVKGTSKDCFNTLTNTVRNTLILK